MSIPQIAALEQMVVTNPMVSSTTLRRGLGLLQDTAAKISPSKARLVVRAVVAARARALQPFFEGGKLDGEEGSLTRLSEKIYLQRLVEEHNRGGKHLELHQPCLCGSSIQGRRCFRIFFDAKCCMRHAELILDGLSLQASIILLGSPARNSN